MTLVSAKKFAEEIGLTPQRVNELCRDGVLTRINGKLNTETEIQKYFDHFGTKEDEEEQKSDDPNFITKSEADRQRAVWNARLSELEYRKEANELMEVSKVKTLAFEASRAVRDRLLTFKSSMPRQLAPINDYREIERILEEEINRVLDDLRKSISIR